MVKKMNNEIEIIKKCKEEIYRVFFKNFAFWWKEEDIQSYFYSVLLEKLPNAVKTVHREYPWVINNKPRKWSGLIDIVILESCNEMDIFQCKIRHAIEIKYPRRYPTLYCPEYKESFKKACLKDIDKLNEKNEKEAINASKNVRKHILFFRKVKKPCFTDINTIEDIINITGFDFSYGEVYPDGRHSKLINNCDLQENIL